jgi:hypothetical protein
MMVTMTRSILVLVLLAGAPASGATPEALAAKQLKAAEKGARQTLLASLASAQAELGSALGDVESSLATAVSPVDPGNALFDALATFQGAVFAARNLASSSQAQAARAALATLGSGLAGVYPDSFYPGDGSATAGFEKAVEKDLAKAYAKVGKRVAKTAGRFADQGFALRYRVLPPEATTARFWSEETVDFLTVLPPTIDLVVSFSDLAVAGDGRMRAAGSGTVLAGGPIETGPLLVSAFANPGTLATVDAQVAEDDGNRWSTDFAGAPFVEGAWLVTVAESVVPGDAVSIGVR